MMMQPAVAALSPLCLILPISSTRSIRVSTLTIAQTKTTMKNRPISYPLIFLLYPRKKKMMWLSMSSSATRS